MILLSLLLDIWRIKEEINMKNTIIHAWIEGKIMKKHGHLIKKLRSELLLTILESKKRLF